MKTPNAEERREVRSKDTSVKRKAGVHLGETCSLLLYKVTMPKWTYALDLRTPCVMRLTDEPPLYVCLGNSEKSGRHGPEAPT